MYLFEREMYFFTYISNKFSKRFYLEKNRTHNIVKSDQSFLLILPQMKNTHTKLVALDFVANGASLGRHVGESD